MLLAPKMTVDEFLASKPSRHPGFRPDSQLDRYPACSMLATVQMPALVELIRRMGGLDAIRPGLVDPTPDGVGKRSSGREYDIVRNGLRESHAFLQRLEDRRPLLGLFYTSGMDGDTLLVTSWHRHNRNLDIRFEIPADWASALWTVIVVRTASRCSTTVQLDKLAAKACDVRIGQLNDPATTYCHITRSTIVL
jgi:hypothetical protein